MKQLFINGGKIITSEVHTPTPNENEILIETKASCVSIGTEFTTLNASKESLITKALNDPKKIFKVLEIVKSKGLFSGVKNVKNKINQLKPLGYSASGKVIEVGKKVRGIKIGDKVACAGGGYAYHAEVITVPSNLVIKMPNNISFNEASTVSLGGIAMQGIRRLNPTLGECVIVIGLGLIGQITVQLLVASGCRVIGVDINKNRVSDALKFGAIQGFLAEEIDDFQKISGNNYPYGADAVIITAANSSSEIISNSFKMCRRKGRVIIVGDIGLNLKREDFYSKEIDILISTSYGPGRYDSIYEEKGIDYPLPYVRWTENRNMSEYLKLISENKININHFIKNTHKITDSERIFQIEKDGAYTSIIEYNYLEKTKTKKFNYNSKNTIQDNFSIGIIGAGSFSRLKIIPSIIKSVGTSTIKMIISKNGISAKSLISDFNLKAKSNSNFREATQNNNLNLVFIVTRHNTHFEILTDAIKNGKNIFIEKPLVINPDELNALKKIVNGLDDKLPIIHTGFNRRFSAHIFFVKEKLANNDFPMLINYRVNAGELPNDHWTKTDEGGGRNIGEACHFYDLICHLVNDELIEVKTNSIPANKEFNISTDNFIVSFRFSNGSIANLIYTSLGSNILEKEHIEIHTNGTSFVINDFKKTIYYGNKVEIKETKYQDKGHENQIIQFFKFLKEAKPIIPISEQIDIMDLTFKIEDEINQ